MNAVLHLVNYAVNTGLIANCERTWALNTLLDVLKADALPDLELNENAGLAETLDVLCDYAYEKGLIPENTVTYRDLFDTELMGRLTPRPAEVISRFETLYAESPKAATDWYYAFSQNVNYIRRERCAKDLRWKVDTAYGEMDISINLSKPEKDPKDIAAARNLPGSTLCISSRITSWDRMRICRLWEAPSSRTITSRAVTTASPWSGRRLRRNSRSRALKM